MINHRYSIYLILFVLLAGCDNFPQYIWKDKPLLERIKESGKLKVLTRYDPTTYYEGPEGFTGLEYDLVQLFAKRLGVEVEFIVPYSFDQILSLISKGEAHIAAAGLTITDKRKKSMRFSLPYRRITEQLIYRSGNRRPKNIQDLTDGILEVVNGSSHLGTLRSIKQQNPNLDWNVNTKLPSYALLNLVNQGLIDYTVADSNQVLLIRRFYPKLYVAFDISEPRHLAWALPQSEDDSLYNKTLEFFRSIKDDKTLDQLIERHYGHAGSLSYVGNCTFREHVIKRLPVYRTLFEQAGAQHSIDWRLLAAIGYQESHWRKNAVSPTGVRGIMMLTQKTAKQLGIRDRSDPKESITGGAQYFVQRKKTIPEHILEPDQTWMALAAYNVGYGHLEDARVLTEKRGGNPDKWMDVKQSLPLLSNKKWYRKTKHGYARGMEPVVYVENIRNYYDLLVWLTENDELQTHPPESIAKDAKKSADLNAIDQIRAEVDQNSLAL